VKENTDPCADCPLAFRVEVEEGIFYVCEYPYGLPWCARSDEEVQSE